MGVSFQLLWVNTKEHNVSSYVKSMPSFCKKPSNCLFQGGLHHFAFLPAMNDSFYCSTSSLVFGIICVTNLGHYNQRRAFASPT